MTFHFRFLLQRGEFVGHHFVMPGFGEEFAIALEPLGADLARGLSAASTAQPLFARNARSRESGNSRPGPRSLRTPHRRSPDWPKAAARASPECRSARRPRAAGPVRDGSSYAGRGCPTRARRSCGSAPRRAVDSRSSISRPPTTRAARPSGRAARNASSASSPARVARAACHDRRRPATAAVSSIRAGEIVARVRLIQDDAPAPRRSRPSAPGSAPAAAD